MSVSMGDALLVVPEAMIIIVSLPLGLIIDRYRWNLRTKLIILASAALCMAVSYMLLVIASTKERVEGSELTFNFTSHNQSIDYSNYSSTNNYNNSNRRTYYSDHNYLHKIGNLGNENDISLFVANNQTHLFFSKYLNAAHSKIFPIIIVHLLGIGYAFSNSLFWGAITEVADNKALSFASGKVFLLHSK